MTEPSTPHSENTRTSIAARIGWVVLICATLYVCYFSHLGAIGFVGPDEPRYAWIARDMMETGDWVTPRLYGKPWFEKPPLFYWGAAICFKWFGVSETSARLPSAISAFLATLALAWLARRWYGAETARWLLLLLPTTVGMIGFSHAAATDMPFSAMLTIAMVWAAVILGLIRDENTPILPRTPWLALLLFGLFLGLAVLAKGPAAIILCGGAVFFWALFTKRWRDAFRLLHPVAIASFCATALPWYILCARRNPDFFRVFIIEHNFKRYLTPEFQHIQPFWFYGPVLLVAFLPWTALFVWSTVVGAVQFWRTQRASESTWLLVCWAGFCLLFFSISQSKLPGYILPALPPIMLVAANALAGKAKTYLKSFRAAASVMALFFFLMLMLSAIGRSRYDLPGRPGGLGWLIPLFLGAANALLALLYPANRASLMTRPSAGLCVLPTLVAVLLANHLLPAFFKYDPSGRSLARQLQTRNISRADLAIGSMQRGQHYSLNFYLHEEIKDWNQENSWKQYLLTTRVGSCRSLIPAPLACEPLPFNEDSTGAFLYRVVMRGSANGTAGGGQPQQKE